ncbi:MAG: hypothetical protein LCH53_04180 [Bacteroidetes bacterium]|nr:hypothetical protein [Bacteroidota bacterium]
MNTIKLPDSLDTPAERRAMAVTVAKGAALLAENLPGAKLAPARALLRTTSSLLNFLAKTF